MGEGLFWVALGVALAVMVGHIVNHLSLPSDQRIGEDRHENNMTKSYVGTKIVTAWPETRTINRGDSAVEEPGYAVKYEDGYISWSPKSSFDAAYLELPDISGLLPHQIRVVAEYVQTKDRYTKLHAFLGTDTFVGLDMHEKERLARQCGVMSELVAVLAERIEAFREPVSTGDDGDVVDGLNVE